MRLVRKEGFVAAIPHPRSTEEESAQVIRLMDASFYASGNGTNSIESGEHSASLRRGNAKMTLVILLIDDSKKRGRERKNIYGLAKDC